MSKRTSKAIISPVEFIDRVIKRDEKGQQFTLAPYQRRVLEMALRRDPSGELVFRLVVLSEPEEIRQDLHGRMSGLMVGSYQPAHRDHHYGKRHGAVYNPCLQDHDRAD
jgi:hypothetical protein